MLVGIVPPIQLLRRLSFSNDLLNDPISGEMVGALSAEYKTFAAIS